MASIDPERAALTSTCLPASVDRPAPALIGCAHRWHLLPVDPEGLRRALGHSVSGFFCSGLFSLPAMC